MSSRHFKKKTLVEQKNEYNKISFRNKKTFAKRRNKLENFSYSMKLTRCISDLGIEIT
jgi:hypothetical protein